MSNAIGTRPSPIPASTPAEIKRKLAGRPLVNATAFTDKTSYQEAMDKVKSTWCYDNLFDRLTGNKYVRPAKTVMTAPYERFTTENVYQRGMFLSAGGKLSYARSSLAGAAAQVVAFGMLPKDPVVMPDGTTIELPEFYDTREGTSYDLDTYRLPPQDEIRKKAENTFFCGGGTMFTLGRVLTATKHDMQTLVSVKNVEADEAWSASGWFYNRSGATLRVPDVCSQPWPLTTDDESADAAKVQVSKHAGIGLPVCGKGGDPDAVRSAISLAKLIINDPVLRSDPKRGYELLMVKNPGLVGMVMKTKSDAYRRDKIEKCMLRPYGVAAAGPRFLFAQVTQPAKHFKATLAQVAKCIDPSRTEGDLPWFSRAVTKMSDIHSSQGIAPTGEGPELIVACLDAQLWETGRAHITHGDDMQMVIRAVVNGKRVIFSFNGDGSNFDLSQTPPANHLLIDRLGDMLASVGPIAGELWRQMMKKRIVVLSGGATVIMEGPVTSGMPMVSELNDLVAQVVALRFFSAIKKDFKNGWYTGPIDKLEAIFTKVGSGLGLTMKFENARVVDVPDHIDSDAYLLRNMIVQGYASLDYLGHKLMGATILTRERFAPPLRFVDELVLDHPSTVQNMRMVWEPVPEMLHTCRAVVGVLNPERILPELQWGTLRFEPDRRLAELRLARTTMCRLQALAPWAVNVFTGSAIKDAAEVVKATIAPAPDDIPIDATELYDFLEDHDVHPGMTSGQLKEAVDGLIASVDAYSKLRAIPADSHVNPARRLRLPTLPAYVAEPELEINDTVFTSWADEAEVEDELEVEALTKLYFGYDSTPAAADMGDAKNLLKRPATKANFGRPAPSVPVKAVMGASTLWKLSADGRKGKGRKGKGKGRGFEYRESDNARYQSGSDDEY